MNTAYISGFGDVLGLYKFTLYVLAYLGLYLHDCKAHRHFLRVFITKYDFAFCCLSTGNVNVGYFYIAKVERGPIIFVRLQLHQGLLSTVI